MQRDFKIVEYTLSGDDALTLPDKSILVLQVGIAKVRVPMLYTGVRQLADKHVKFSQTVQLVSQTSQPALAHYM